MSQPESSKRYVIGLTGFSNAGKGEAAKIMSESYGFTWVSVSSILGQIALEKYGATDRHTLERVYGELGEEILAQRLVVRSRAASKVVVDSIRSVRLLDALEDNFTSDFTLVEVAAPEQERFRRLQHRARPGDPASLDEMKALDELQLGATDVHIPGYQMSECLARATITIHNNSQAINELAVAVAGTLQSLGIA